MTFRTLLRPALPLLALGLLAACSGAPDSAAPQVLADTGPSATSPAGPGSASPSGPSGPPDDAARSTGPREVTSRVQPDGTILVKGSQASFLMPSRNVACVLQPDHVVCQIDGKQYSAGQADINPEAFQGCDPRRADAMSVGGGADPSWACLPYDIRPGTDVAAGGAWAGPGVGATDTLDGRTVALLPYGSTLRLGNVSCTSDRLGVDCTDLTTGRGFQLARETYTTH
ncbi:hypothetical protein [Ornithinimicrobium cavernae]|uniref:hypothetical protein n=1 Tax=Ornithinimicrobium cavernae TaxID=2666047 RepID=UPI000D6987B5|nr:hypothetical protein [Ornithinimicrobium cavernae]